MSQASTYEHPEHGDPRSAEVAKVADLIDGIRTAMLTTVDGGGRLVSRPMATQEVEFDGDLWFFAAADSPKVADVEGDHRVNVAYAGDDGWVSVAGRADVVRDPERATELWNGFAGAWFQNGPEDPNVVLIRVHADTAEYWETPGKVATVLDLVSARIRGDQPDPGENATVDL